jgi:hypothetical protein
MICLLSYVDPSLQFSIHQSHNNNGTIDLKTSSHRNSAMVNSFISGPRRFCQHLSDPLPSALHHSRVLSSSGNMPRLQSEPIESHWFRLARIRRHVRTQLILPPWVSTIVYAPLATDMTVMPHSPARREHLAVRPAHALTVNPCQ